mmetsp:Transcript_17753/g.25597  ORF Transcript_17753/g.25597 Transcript_17753/m.25597 type:complete len:234 (+) Transcript_17753:216-917(+)
MNLIPSCAFVLFDPTPHRRGQRLRLLIDLLQHVVIKRPSHDRLQLKWKRGDDPVIGKHVVIESCMKVEYFQVTTSNVNNIIVLHVEDFVCSLSDCSGIRREEILSLKTAIWMYACFLLIKHDTKLRCYGSSSIRHLVILGYLVDLEDVPFSASVVLGSDDQWRAETTGDQLVGVHSRTEDKRIRSLQLSKHLHDKSWERQVGYRLDQLVIQELHKFHDSFAVSLRFEFHLVAR